MMMAFKFVGIVTVEKGQPAPVASPNKASIDCIRCKSSLTFIGTKSFHEVRAGAF